MRGRLPKVLPWLEVAFGAALGLVLYLPLHQGDLAGVCWVLTVIIGIARLGFVVDLRRELNPVHLLVQAFELRDNSDSGLRELIKLYDKISAPELQILRDDFLRKACAELIPMAQEMTSPPLAPSHYYEWLSQMMQEAKRGTVVRAVSTMLESEWDESPSERRYLEENVKATKRGAVIERLFIVPKSRIDDFFAREVASTHSSKQLPRLKGYFITTETLGSIDGDLLKRLGEGFVAFGHSAALIDITVPPDQARGLISVNPTRIGDLVHSFEQAKLHSAQLAKK